MIEVIFKKNCKSKVNKHECLNKCGKSSIQSCEYLDQRLKPNIFNKFIYIAYPKI